MEQRLAQRFRERTVPSHDPEKRLAHLQEVSLALAQANYEETHRQQAQATRHSRQEHRDRINTRQTVHLPDGTTVVTEVDHDKSQIQEYQESIALLIEHKIKQQVVALQSQCEWVQNKAQDLALIREAFFPYIKIIRTDPVIIERLKQPLYSMSLQDLDEEEGVLMKLLSEDAGIHEEPILIRILQSRVDKGADPLKRIHLQCALELNHTNQPPRYVKIWLPELLLRHFPAYHSRIVSFYERYMTEQSAEVRTHLQKQLAFDLETCAKSETPDDKTDL